MAYRSNQNAVDAARAEEREMAVLMRDARMRRVRAAITMGAVFVMGIGGTQLAARSSLFPRLPTLHCHGVVVQYEETGGGTPPPPLSWQVCERR
jgi:hypothetical protein